MFYGATVDLHRRQDAFQYAGVEAKEAIGSET